MGKASRTKGVTGELELAAIWERAGFEVRGLEASGDHLVICRNGLTIHQEGKRQERIKLPEWWEQTVAEAPAGTLPVLSFRPSRTRWRSVLWTDDLAALIARLP